jgi:hypothetical protein
MYNQFYIFFSQNKKILKSFYNEIIIKKKFHHKTSTERLRNKISIFTNKTIKLNIVHHRPIIKLYLFGYNYINQR